MPYYINSDRGPSFMLSELKVFQHSKGITTSWTNSYNSWWNEDIERINRTVWSSVQLALKSKQLPLSMWELVLPDALHSIWYLLWTANNCTSHERLFNYHHKLSTGSSIPNWLSNSKKVPLQKHVRENKYEPSVMEIKLLQANPEYGYIWKPDGNENMVSLRDLALKPINGNLPRESIITGGKVRLHSDTGRNEED